MKKFVLALLVAFVAAVAPSRANAEAVELDITYGGYTAMDAVNTYHQDWTKVHTAWGALNANLYFRVLPKFSIGPSYTFSSANTDGGANHSTVYYNAILLNGKYQYYRNSIVKLYARLGLGVEISHYAPKYFESHNSAYFGFQVSPLGATVDLTPSFGLMGEVGFGCQGIIQAGVKFSF